MLIRKDRCKLIRRCRRYCGWNEDSRGARRYWCCDQVRQYSCAASGVECCLQLPLRAARLTMDDSSRTRVQRLLCSSKFPQAHTSSDKRLQDPIGRVDTVIQHRPAEHLLTSPRIGRPFHVCNTRCYPGVGVAPFNSRRRGDAAWAAP